MNENTKTGIFWGIAFVMLAIALLVAWPQQERSEQSLLVGKPLFEQFEDPLAAASMRIVSFDEVLGQLNAFEVRKDRETGMWTIPSRQGYPADAVEQMRDAANALVGLIVLDIQTDNVELHDDLGVLEPKLEDLEVGDVGVGRMVTFKDPDQKTIASLIIGNPVEGEEGKIYVRKPGQDPVYVVRLDDSPLSTRFENWIEEDLLRLTSIDIQELEIKDYNAALGLGGVSLTRNYDAKVTTDGTDWTIERVLVYDRDNPTTPPTEAPPEEGKEPNASKFDEIKNALDDLKIVDVVRKPEGMSANLRADKELVSDNEAVASLAQRGFFPLQLGPDGETEVISANGELTATLRDGVRYVLRFGNVSGVTDEDESPEEDATPTAGVNRYLLVTAEVDPSRFPVPELQDIPQTIAELEELLRIDEPEPQPDPEIEISPEDARPADADPAADDAPTADADPEADDAPAAGDAPTADDAPAAGDDSPPNDAAEETDAPGADSGDGDGGNSGDNGDGENGGDNGDGENGAAGDNGNVDGDRDGDDADADAANDPDNGAPTDTEGDPADDRDGSPGEADTEGLPADGDETTDTASAEPPTEPETADEVSPTPQSELDGLTDEEKQERLESEQEKITKENQRKLDERNEQIETARRKVRELNARFADWYYVIPENTYQQLRVRRADLFVAEGTNADDADPPSGPTFDAPEFNFPNP